MPVTEADLNCKMQNTTVWTIQTSSSLVRAALKQRDQQYLVADEHVEMAS